MKTIINLFTALIIAAWMISLSTLSIQNITPVSLKFLIFESIQFPLGVLLSFAAGIGVLLGAVIPILWRSPKKSPRRRFSGTVSDDIDELDEFDF